MNVDARILQDRLISRLREFESAAGKPGRYVIAYSGGIDSTVLLHALVSVRSAGTAPIIAIHVDHGLHPRSSQWEKACRAQARELGVDYRSHKVVVSRDAGGGLEAAAREARYAILGSVMQPGDWLLSAHHETDQAETLLLNLLRGSSLTGLAGMGAIRKFSRGFLLRPLLGISGEAIREYAHANRLGWTDDPSNTDTAFDRNYLRQNVMPLLAARWPAAMARLRQSADLAAEASELLAELADLDISDSPSSGKLDIDALSRLSAARQRNVIRRAVQRCGLPAPPASRLYQAVHELLPAKEDAQPLVTWPGAEIRRYRKHLYILAPMAVGKTETAAILKPDSMLDLGIGQGKLSLEPVGKRAIESTLARRGLELRYREGGEEITLPGRPHSRKLKKLLQEKGIVPWMRDRLPLLYDGDRLVAVADLWIAAECIGENGFLPKWSEGPDLY